MHLYFHIPFCKKACHYCDFHFSTNLSTKEEIIDSVCLEIEQRKDYLEDKNLQTIYFGGGTPSLLNEEDFNKIFNSIESNFILDNCTEITLEANPEDITERNLKVWKDYGINRLSVGVQSFDNTVLKFLNREHDGNTLFHALEKAREMGFDSFSLDIIYGIPGRDNNLLIEDVNKIVGLNSNHISAYCLSIEPKTYFGNLLSKGQFKEASDSFSSDQFLILKEMLANDNFEHYEVSNFAKNKKYSVHNSAYWEGKSYLGIGPAAHSFNRISRQFNVANNAKYINALRNGTSYFEQELLTNRDKANEYIMTSLRTKWGLDLNKLKNFGLPMPEEINSIIENYQGQGKLQRINEKVILKEDGFLWADKIASELFII